MARSLLLLLLGAAAASAAPPPYDFAGHWNGSVAVGADVLALDANLTTTGRRRFDGNAVLDTVACSVRGKRTRKVVIRLRCTGGTIAKLTGMVDVGSEAVTGNGRLSGQPGGRRRGTFVLSRASVAVCGNGVPEGGEQCDDGNLDPGDGCGPACMTEGEVVVEEVEPNDSPATSTAGGSPPFRAAGTIQPEADQDFFRVVVGGSGLVLETFDGSGQDSCAPEVDTIVELWGPDGTTMLALDDDGGIGECSRLVLDALIPGVYFACIRGFGGGTVPAYRLSVTAP